MSYQAPVAEMRRLARLLGHDRLAATERYAEATSETRDAILTEAAKMAEEVLAPLNRSADLEGARLENGVIRTSPGFHEGYRAIAEGGWVGLSADPEHGGMGLPRSLGVMVNEMMASACLSLSLCPLLSGGQIEALEAHGSAALKALYLPKLTSGAWTGTMNLTEPQAGSDVGALRSKAEPAGDGSYRVSGQKIWISWGDHDFAENVVHLVLARLPDAPRGSRGVSLFLVPKRLPDEDGRPGVANSLSVVSLEHKMGLHGSPTCVMAFEEAKGWLVGEENKGLACMFTMMNNARLNVGIEGVAIAEMATQATLAWAMERVQGRTADGSATIVGHADVRRMLMTMKALTRAARAICYDCAFSLDMAQAGEDEATREKHARRGAFLTPIAKAYGTDTGIEVSNLAVQVHGGAGYAEDTGIAQYFRDVRITAIYEGTNGVQAMDLVGRKLAGDGGATALALLSEARGTADRSAGNEPVLAAALVRAVIEAEAVTQHLAMADETTRGAAATPYLRLLALVLGGASLLRAATEGGADAAEAEEARALAAFHILQLLPMAHAHAAAAKADKDALYTIDATRLAATV
ncbi:MAG: acyl-CoA dehydrogenase family protein [Pseudomonadota bacterium]